MGKEADPALLSQLVRVARINARLTHGRDDPEPEPGKVFLSYRREDAGHAGRLFDWLERTFSKERLFLDVTDIEPGTDFLARIDKELKSAKVLLVLIGPRWLSVADAAGRRRLDDPHDIVRREVARGLQRKDLTILPVLLAGAPMPTASDLPVGLRPLTRRNALDIDDARWEEGMNRLIESLQRVLGKPADAAGAAELTMGEVMTKLILIVDDFLADPDPEGDIGDFLIVGAGPIKDDKPEFGIEIRVRDGVGWYELDSTMSTKDEVTIINQVTKLQELGWKHPPEGGYKKSFFKGSRLTRWWRPMGGETAEESIADISEAIIGTFSELYETLPEGVGVGWNSHPHQNPAAPGEAEVSSKEETVTVIWPKLAAWW